LTAGIELYPVQCQTLEGANESAESVADHCKKQLIQLDAVTLGTTVRSVQSELERAFKLAEKWQALLLLDEAYVYLEQRRAKSLVHGLVSG